MGELSRASINRAGRVLRGWARGDLTAPDDYRRALNVLQQYRREHRVPLTKATMGLRSAIETERCMAQVSQRLKRVPTIVDKLVREPTMSLAAMHDIGGCRSVLTSLDELRRVRERISRNRPALKERDYIAAPRPSGYRAVHVIVEYDGKPVEIQLRTLTMHEWAVAVERLGVRIGTDLKSGAGPRQVLELLRGISEVMSVEESGEPVGSDALGMLEELQQAARPFLEGDQR